MNKASWKMRYKQMAKRAVILQGQSEVYMAQIGELKFLLAHNKEMEKLLRNHTPLVTTNFEALAKERWETVARERGDELREARKAIARLQQYADQLRHACDMEEKRADGLEKQIDALKEDYNLL